MKNRWLVSCVGMEFLKLLIKSGLVWHERRIIPLLYIMFSDNIVTYTEDNVINHVILAYMYILEHL